MAGAGDLVGPARPGRGDVAVVKHGYFTAAGIEGYTVHYSRETKAWSLVANVIRADPYLMAQRPLLFVVPRKRTVWRWELGRFQLVDGRRLIGGLSAPLP